MNALFDDRNAHLLRAYLARHVPEIGSAENLEVSVMVVNAADQCALTCPNCLFSAAMAKKIFGGSPPRLSMDQMRIFVKIMNEAKAQLLVFSGGGESYENMDAMCYAVENLENIHEVVTITSVYFAESAEATERMLDRFIDAMRRGNKMRGRNLTFILRISYDTFHNVSVENVLHAIRYAVARSDDGINIRPVVRTILDPNQNLDIQLAQRLGAELLPEKNPSDPVINLPIIDAFPTRWLVTGDMEIPVIYKPTYFLGFAKKMSKQDVPGTSWSDVKKVEEIGDSFFNLSMRGTHGEGHNFYETVLRGYTYWRSKLGQVPNYNTPRQFHSRRLSVYLPANGRMIVNASSPDSWQPVEHINSWKGYWETISRDVLQLTAVTRPTDVLLGYAREVEPGIDSLLDMRNFVFQVAYSAMETPALRLYTTMRLLQDYAKHGIMFADHVVRELTGIPQNDLANAYQAAKHFRLVEKDEASHPEVIDPIIGNQMSIWTEDLNQLCQPSANLKDLTEFIRQERRT
ncbi:MAG: hypothetical protein A3A98_01085 [Candidatus Staskawiczbacteria bacterium RIFCSPLOWO2_01_FULL_40_39]|uniref:Uncharacterized protein n=1 Tax=Candidatus Staskawiczbacteria bacterium RIFCSPHIGHO2_01_FULL_39_25 TaxID=1802202 RepID=A0A1G2HN58_9BACT|nr:MAG: hypothetical protein A2730_01085 [Candidatus Staskawiczbacteria bacterium RIFCSPHIGHO2_01_FULL_39_25]OGZ73323.1 MAG: hypothetical protein A3A98_01085 [Candidatus Staskawiczbacteria bacterium RIFCSPLOWO2_01_FULL_40_39]